MKGAISAVPIAGGAAAELFALIVAPPIERRRDRWLEYVAEAVREIEARVAGLTPEQLSHNETFVSTLLHATQIASRNHQEEKLQALRNAIVGAALPDAPVETMQRMFLNYVDDLTPWHLRILSFFNDPSASGTRIVTSAGSLSQLLEVAVPELRGQREFYDQVVRDLESRGLMVHGGIHGMMTASGMLASRTTNWGKEFLQFISLRNYNSSHKYSRAKECFDNVKQF